MNESFYDCFVGYSFFSDVYYNKLCLNNSTLFLFILIECCTYLNCVVNKTVTTTDFERVIRKGNTRKRQLKIHVNKDTTINIYVLKSIEIS